MNDERIETILEESRMAQILATLQERNTALVDAILEEMKAETDRLVAALAGDYSIVYLEGLEKNLMEMAGNSPERCCRVVKGK